MRKESTPVRIAPLHTFVPYIQHARDLFPVDTFWAFELARPLPAISPRLHIPCRVYKIIQSP